MNTQPITLASVEAFCFRVPVQTPIKVAFGTFRDRPLVLVHVLAAAGGDGLLEYDCHPNVSRGAVVGSLLPVHNGRVPVPQTPCLCAAGAGTRGD